MNTKIHEKFRFSFLSLISLAFTLCTHHFCALQAYPQLLSRGFIFPDDSETVPINTLCVYVCMSLAAGGVHLVHTDRCTYMYMNILA